MEAIPSIVSENPAPIEKRRLLSDLKDDAAHKGCCGSLRRHGFYVFALSVVAALGIALIAISVRGPHGSDAACDVSVVESIPLNTTGLSSGAESTYAAFLWLLDNAKSSIDVTAMYWTLNSPARDGKKKCDAAADDCPDDAGFTPQELEDFGVAQGRAVWLALEDAARRGVRIRIVQSPGLNNSVIEPTDLARISKRVEVRTADMSAWYDSGIMHAKVWIVDGRHGYVGSANMDWRSFTQTRETGAMLRNCPRVTTDLTRIFEAFWDLANTTPNPGPHLKASSSSSSPTSRAGRLWKGNGGGAGMLGSETRDAFDPALQLDRKVPCWSSLIQEGDRCQAPLRLADVSGGAGVSGAVPVRLSVSGGAPGPPADANVRLSLSPPELCGTDRWGDEDMLVDTIESASPGGFVYVTVMDFQPVTKYLCRAGEVCPPFESFYWPRLVDALLRVATGKGADVRLLVSRWYYDAPGAQELLWRYQHYTDYVCSNYTSSYRMPCGGSFEIREIRLPGWDEVAGQNRTYPGHTRVSHSKFIVSDQRANIGTSNMQWSYFWSTAGVSFNVDDARVVAQLKHMFELAWDHPTYTTPI